MPEMKACMRPGSCRGHGLAGNMALQEHHGIAGPAMRATDGAWQLSGKHRSGMGDIAPQALRQSKLCQ